MRKLIPSVVIVLGVSGCATTYELQKNTLSTDDKISVVQAKVDNPYPECSKDEEATRVADLSIERSERVYLQKGRLCQRSK